MNRPQRIKNLIAKAIHRVIVGGYRIALDLMLDDLGVCADLVNEQGEKPVVRVHLVLISDWGVAPVKKMDVDLTMPANHGWTDGDPKEEQP